MAFTRSVIIINAQGKKFELVDTYSPSAVGSHPVQVDPVAKATDLNQWVRRSEVKIIP
ncbi:MAG: hypothetical protein Q8P59_11325 [Dehalococcoidia bacterium]|nr:hypothetical protein [Dehalococcoidia bacterium]